MGRAVARRHRGKGTGAGVGRGRARVGSSRDALQEQLALRDCLELLGIPFLATSDVAVATRRPLVLIGGILLNTQPTPPERETLYAYVERGGGGFGAPGASKQIFPPFWPSPPAPPPAHLLLWLPSA